MRRNIFEGNFSRGLKRKLMFASMCGNCFHLLVNNRHRNDDFEDKTNNSTLKTKETYLTMRLQQFAAKLERP